MVVIHKTGMNLCNHKWEEIGKKSATPAIHRENLAVFRKIKLFYVYIQRAKNRQSR